MGYYYCKPRPCDARTPNVVLILAVALILLCAPKLFSGEAEEEEEETNNTSPFVVPILIVLILLLLSLLGSSRRRVCVKPPYCRCTRRQTESQLQDQHKSLCTIHVRRNGYHLI
ncbi:hypothetical protein E2542_SST10669 [Spatholobus suberectus]|nr:hypothetical protein E2542_SST10669 [Spatholobus suberectus]